MLLPSERADKPPHGGRDKYQMSDIDLLMTGVDFPSSLVDIVKKSLLNNGSDRMGLLNIVLNYDMHRMKTILSRKYA